MRRSKAGAVGIEDSDSCAPVWSYTAHRKALERCYKEAMCQAPSQALPALQSALGGMVRQPHAQSHR